MNKTDEYKKQTTSDFITSIFVYPFASVPYIFIFGIFDLLLQIFIPQKMNEIFETVGFLLYVYIYLGFGVIVFLISIVQLIRSKSPAINAERIENGSEHIVPLSYVIFCFNAKYHTSKYEGDYDSDDDDTGKQLVDALNKQNELLEEANRLQRESNELLKK